NCQPKILVERASRCQPRPIVGSAQLCLWGEGVLARPIHEQCTCSSQPESSLQFESVLPISQAKGRKTSALAGFFRRKNPARRRYLCAMAWHFWFIDLPGEQG